MDYTIFTGCKVYTRKLLGEVLFIGVRQTSPDKKMTIISYYDKYTTQITQQVYLTKMMHFF